MADAKFSMPDGSYPINNCADVSDAAGLAHHSKTYSFAQVKAHVMKAKNALNCPDSALPATWTAASKPIPKENLVRGIFPLEFRDAEEGRPTLAGHFAVFNQWTEIDSAWEGNFMERIAPGAFARTFNNNREGMRVLFQHGKDPDVGDKPIAAIDVLEEDDHGARYEASLFDGLPPLILDGLRHGQYGASFRFRVVHEEMNKRAEASDANPEGIPERTITEAQVMEFGPVTFPAYAGATAGIRSLTDEFILAQLIGDPERVTALMERFANPIANPAPALTPGPEPAAHSVAVTRTAVRPSLSRDEFLARLEKNHR